MTTITLSDLKTDPGKYVRLAQEQEILITRYGKVVAKLVTATPDRQAAWDTITGIFQETGLGVIDDALAQARAERLAEQLPPET